MIVGGQTGSKLGEKARANISTWVNDGGLLIGFGIHGLDDVFGVRSESVLKQPLDDYTISAHLEFRPHTLTREVHPYMLLEQQLLAISDVAPAKTERRTGTGASL